MIKVGYWYVTAVYFWTQSSIINIQNLFSSTQFQAYLEIGIQH